MSGTAGTAVEPDARPDSGDGLAGGITYRAHLAAGALLAVLALAVIAGALAWRQYQDAQKKTLGNERGRAVLAGSVIDTYFRGQLATLRSIARSPSVVSLDHPAIRRYFERLQRPGDPTFSAGLGWIDARGFAVVTTQNRALARQTNLSDRSYFWNVMATGDPYVSEAVTSRLTHKRVIVTAVPTRDGNGHLTGVLVGVLMLDRFGLTHGALDVVGPDVAILDRAGRLLQASTTVPRNLVLAHSLHGNGVIADTRGLDGSDGHVIAYSRSAIPGWTVVVDKPRGALLADARRGFFLQLALIAAAASIVLFMIAFTLLRGRREAERERSRERQRRDLTRILGGASLGSEVSDGLAAGLHDAFPERSASSRSRRRIITACRSRPPPTEPSRPARPRATSWWRRLRRWRTRVAARS